MCELCRQDCAKVGSLEEITNAICDFLAKKLVIEIEDDSKLDEIIRQTESAVKTVEPDVKLVDWDEKQESEEKHKESLLKLLMLWHRQCFLCFGFGSLSIALVGTDFFVVSYLLSAAKF